jgi:hypothetical protein
VSSTAAARHHHREKIMKTWTAAANTQSRAVIFTRDRVIEVQLREPDGMFSEMEWFPPSGLYDAVEYAKTLRRKHHLTRPIELIPQ